ncbi:DgyrCDS6264 [Dimorphilus gyrociliatus]|uniref:DgyrCDS6264 n=1 Tax=Dimorphilus gyrociliatus TaxID=2664684 RepID=A0A7I8VMI5_9ANNE|nr:DgyrCDS6264 [Dimorphilus gyrociliatus]
MKIYKSEHVFEHPWETVVQAAWRKYPNPMNPNVVGVDVVDRQVTTDGVLRSHRLMSTFWGVPDFVTRLIGLNRTAYVSEVSEVNHSNKTMQLFSRNLTLSNLVTIDEKLEYKPHPTRPSCTLLEQEAVIKIEGVPLTTYLEDLMLKTCSSNAAKGRQAMEIVIHKIKSEAGELTRAAQESVDNIINKASL